jgi:hypothetical protein
MDSGQRSGYFRGVKIALIVFQSIGIIGAIALTILNIMWMSGVNSSSAHGSSLSKYLNQAYFYKNCF